MSTEHFLTKTRFKIGLECPTKLYYLSEKYPSSKSNNEFLQVHADGGHQVGEYAKFVIQAKYPNHHTISFKSINALSGKFSFGEKVIESKNLMYFE